MRRLPLLLLPTVQFTVSIVDTKMLKKTRNHEPGSHNPYTKILLMDSPAYQKYVEKVIPDLAFWSLLAALVAFALHCWESRIGMRTFAGNVLCSRADQAQPDMIARTPAG